jgi:hypothetical protein
MSFKKVRQSAETSSYRRIKRLGKCRGTIRGIMAKFIKPGRNRSYMAQNHSITRKFEITVTIINDLHKKIAMK